ncbi:hypothetical protein NIES4106_59470 (plasmid) [Fischerella sp. NIES-4106]|nr:hypothetical protein NIES4106_59470 [Fischerella sp. NIES-4106]
MSATALAAPPQTWKEHWFDHDQLLSLVHHNEHVAVYYDKDVSRSVTWPFTYMAEVWQYTKKVYGKFGSDSRLYAIYHTNKYSGGHPSTYLDGIIRQISTVASGALSKGAGTKLPRCFLVRQNK